ncbi:MAG: ROK family transcriptional regulator, partial [Bacteroidota bacterium]
MSPIEATSTKRTLRLTAPIVVDSSEAEIMRALRRQGRISRSEISSITGWSKAKASQQIRSLVSKGYLVEAGEGASQGGRKPGLLQLNDRLGYIAGIDIGATSLEIALADVTGVILQRRSEDTDVRLSPQAVLGRCRELLFELIAAQGGLPEELLGIGVGVPGPVDFARGVLVAPPLMPAWENFKIRDYMKESFPA